MTSGPYGPWEFLLDEDAENEALAGAFVGFGHVVTRVQDEPELGKGADDRDDIGPWVQRHGRVLLTYDDDFTGREPDDVNPAETVSVLYVVDQSLSPGRIARIVDVMTSYVPREELRAGIYEADPAWLEYEG